MRSRLLPTVLAAIVAALLVGAVFASDAVAASRSAAARVSDQVASTDPHGTPCITDLRCAGQTVTAATGPLAQADAAVATLGAALLAAGLIASTPVPLRDRLAASRLFRPPRLAG